MAGKLQFSIGYLLLETLWIGVLFALTRVIWLHRDGEWTEYAYGPLLLLCYAGFPVVLSIAIGGIFGRMHAGAIIGGGLILLLLTLLFVVAIFVQRLPLAI